MARVFREFIHTVLQKEPRAHIVADVALTKQQYEVVKAQMTDKDATREERYEYDEVGGRTFIRSDAFAETVIHWVQRKQWIHKQGELSSIYAEVLDNANPHSAPMVTAIRHIQILEKNCGEWITSLREIAEIRCTDDMPKTIEESNAVDEHGRPLYSRKRRRDLAEQMHDTLVDRPFHQYIMRLEWISKVARDASTSDPTYTTELDRDTTNMLESWKTRWRDIQQFVVK